MLRCDLDGGNSPLGSIKAVSDHLTERIKLELPDDPSNNNKPLHNIVATEQLISDQSSESQGSGGSGGLLNLYRYPFALGKTTTAQTQARLRPGDGPGGVVPPYGLASTTAQDDPQQPTSAATMNNNLMFRSMFFMNDEARHFLAPALPLPPTESDYFQKKVVSTSTAGVNVGGLENHTGDQTGTAENQVPTGTNQVDKETSTVPLQLPKQRPHTCEECGKSFLMKHHLATHMRIHTGERPHVCPECGKSFALKHCLSTHLLLHSAERPYKCPECSKTFTLKHHLVSHERVHTRDRPFECPECGRRFPQKRHLTTHIKFHSGERPYSCPICGESFSREEHLVMHSRFHGGQRPFVCPDCGVGFLRKFELVNHERQHGRNPESCPACGKEFLQKRTLLVHIRTCGLPPATPPTPPSQTPSPPRFLADQAQANKTCKECGETFASVEGLALHLRLHVGDHSFLSDICSLAATLKQSAMTAAVLGNKKPHVCSDCGRGFSQKHGLFQHRQRHQDGTCKLKPFACEKCGKCFAQKNHLYLHERQHMDKPYDPNRNSNANQQAQQAQQQQQQAQQQTQQAQQQQQQPPQGHPQMAGMQGPTALKQSPDHQQRPEGNGMIQPGEQRGTIMHQNATNDMDPHRQQQAGHPGDQSQLARQTQQQGPDRRHLEQLPVSLIQQPRQGQGIDQQRHLIRQTMSSDMNDQVGSMLQQHHTQQRHTQQDEGPPTSSCHMQQAAAKNF